MSGRKVSIPKTVNKVLPLSSNSTVDIYTLAPDKLAGVSFAFNGNAKKYIKEKYQDLTVVGTTEKIDYETILNIHPDLIVCSEEAKIGTADEIQNKLNIPVVIVNSSLQDMDKMYTLLGECLGEEERAKKLADYSRSAMDNIKNMVKNIPENEKVKVYYAEGTNWLQTDVSGNVHTQVLDMAGAKNVADVSEAKSASMASVSMEQVLSWNPDVIIEGASAAKGSMFSNVSKDASWSKINAVKNNKCYKIPALPFNVVDRPPSSARILGIQWLGNLLYPQYVKIDITKEMKNFYQLFYDYKLTDEEVNTLLKNAVSK